MKSDFVKKKFFEGVSFLLRYVELLLCLRKRMYKKRTRRVNPSAEYYHNKSKFRQMYA